MENTPSTNNSKIKVKLGVTDGLRFGLGFGVGMFIWSLILMTTVSLILYYFLSEPLNEFKAFTKDPFGINKEIQALTPNPTNKIKIPPELLK